MTFTLSSTFPFLKSDKAYHRPLPPRIQTNTVPSISPPYNSPKKKPGSIPALHARPSLKNVKKTKRNKQKTINLFWWRPKHFINLGDELNHSIVAFLSKRNICKTTIQNTDLLGIGSILDWATPRERVYPVWGTGTLAPHHLQNSLYKISLLRGPLTHGCFTNPGFKIPYGDPALICDHIWPGNTEKKYDWGLIVHHSHYQKPWLRQILQHTPNILFIDIMNPNIDQFMKQITSCKAIASSSLHGLIVADSYHLPNLWLWDGNLHTGGKWKFHDYFAGIRRTFITDFNPNTYHNLNTIPIDHEDFSYLDNLKKIKQQIIDSFPL